MNAREFFELLLPTNGVIFTAHPLPSGGWHNSAHKTIDEAVASINGMVWRHEAAYFALATYTQERYLDANAIDPKTGKPGKWKSRTQENAAFMRSFFLDLDVDANDSAKFPDKLTALTELKAFVKKLGLPQPMLVDSGGGIHAYWPLAIQVPVSEWRPIADQFKAICLHEKFRADRTLTADQARVLRALGSYNIRRGAPVRLLKACAAPYSFQQISQIITDYADSIGATGGKSFTSGLAKPIGGSAPSQDPFEDNLGATNDPVNFDQVAFGCNQLAYQASVRGNGVGEQLWRAGLGVVKFCDPIEPAWRAISDGHPDFDEAKTLAKLAGWHSPPTRCEHFAQLEPSRCAGCPHHGKITSPAQLGRMVQEAPPPAPAVLELPGMTVEVEIPDLPSHYMRRATDRAILMKTENDESIPVFEVVCPYDIYPITLRAQTGVDANIDERSLWRVHLPLEKGKSPTARDIDIPLAAFADAKTLSKILFSKGVTLTGEQPKMMHLYMTAYLQKLAEAAGREKLYDRLGWHDDHTAFVMGDRVMFRDGKMHTHQPGNAIRNTTKNGLKTAGTLAAWQAALQFYNRPGYEGHRFFLYAAFGAPLFHMNDTGNKGAMLTASGESGRGKTTCLKVCSSIYGHPDAMIMNGNKEGSTVNALYSALGTMHSLPFMWDDITEREADELRRFLLNISQGQGKRRMTADANQNGNMDTWETLVLGTANTDDVSRILASGRDVNPHLMRLISVEFSKVDTGPEAKIAADTFLRAINENYGHAGPLYLSLIVKHYEKIRNGYIKNVAMVDRMLGSANASAERYWSAAVAAAYTGAQIAQKIGLINFPIDADLQWMVSHLGRQREQIKESSSTPMDHLVTFLNANIRSMVVLAAKQSSNLDNVAVRPSDELQIRHEMDQGLMYVARQAIVQYCVDTGIAFKTFEYALEREGVLLARNAQKVLGADTVWASGQVRCWKLDARKISGLAAPAPAATNASNVVPLRANGATP